MELALVGDHSTVSLTQVSYNTFFFKSQNASKVGTLYSCQKGSKVDFQTQFNSLLIHIIKSPPLRSPYYIWRRESKCDVSPFLVDFSIGLRKDINTHSFFEGQDKMHYTYSVLTLFLTDLVTWYTMRGLIPPSPGRNRVKELTVLICVYILSFYYIVLLDGKHQKTPHYYNVALNCVCRCLF